MADESGLKQDKGSPIKIIDKFKNKTNDYDVQKKRIEKEFNNDHIEDFFSCV